MERFMPRGVKDTRNRRDPQRARPPARALSRPALRTAAMPRAEGRMAGMPNDQLGTTPSDGDDDRAAQPLPVDPGNPAEPAPPSYALYNPTAMALATFLGSP